MTYALSPAVASSADCAFAVTGVADVSFSTVIATSSVVEKITSSILLIVFMNLSLNRLNGRVSSITILVTTTVSSRSSMISFGYSRCLRTVVMSSFLYTSASAILITVNAGSVIACTG